jgi:hypothetical protein
MGKSVYNKTTAMSTNKKSKEFKLSSLAIDNKMTVYVVMVLFFILGITTYYDMPRGFS